MTSVFSPVNFKNLCRKAGATDPALKKILDDHGYPPMWTRPNTFETLVHIILEQQVSLASALSALNKLRERIGNITPARLVDMTDAELKACYFSRQKTAYVRGLAEALNKGDLSLGELETMPDDEVRQRLIGLKGIGNWTIDVYLIFVLNRTDIFPAGDLAAVNAVHRVKNLRKKASHPKLLSMARKWAPYRTIATMLLWHYYLSAPRKKKPSG